MPNGGPYKAFKNFSYLIQVTLHLLLSKATWNSILFSTGRPNSSSQEFLHESGSKVMFVLQFQCPKSYSSGLWAGKKGRKVRDLSYNLPNLPAIRTELFTLNPLIVRWCELCYYLKQHMLLFEIIHLDSHNYFDYTLDMSFKSTISSNYCFTRALSAKNRTNMASSGSWCTEIKHNQKAVAVGIFHLSQLNGTNSWSCDLRCFTATWTPESFPHIQFISARLSIISSSLQPQI